MTSVSYAVGASNASQEYFSSISSVLGVLGVLSGRHKPLKGRCYLSNGAWITPSLCPSMRWVQPRFPEAPSGCRTDALRSGARRGGASVRRVPLRRRGGNMWRALAHLPPVGAWITPSLMRTFFLSESKKCQTFNLRSHTQFCYREKVVLLACANSPPERYRRIRVL